MLTLSIETLKLFSNAELLHYCEQSPFFSDSIIDISGAKFKVFISQEIKVEFRLVNGYWQVISISNAILPKPTYGHLKLSNCDYCSEAGKCILNGDNLYICEACINFKIENLNRIKERLHKYNDLEIILSNTGFTDSKIDKIDQH